MSDPKYTDEDLKRVAGIVEEQSNDKLDVVIEIISDIQHKVNKIDKIEEDVTELKSDMKIVKAAVTSTNRDLHKVERRTAKLEVV